MTLSLRGAVRTSLAVLLGVIAGSRLVSAWQSFLAYHEWRARDPSTADASLTFSEVDFATAILGIAGAWLAWWLFRPRGGAPPPGTVS